jgi:hypothetical protein
LVGLRRLTRGVLAADECQRASESQEK